MEYDAAALSPVELFVHAGPVAKAVIIILLVASIWCWELIIEGIWAVWRLNRAIAAAKRNGGIERSKTLSPILKPGHSAAALSIAGETAGEGRTRVLEAMSRAAQSLLAEAEGGLPNLAVISSVAPFIGLFGTVWGIMVSFAAIAGSKDTNLAVVAPGIAQALAATAIGLAAAIPATIGYNRIGSSLARAGQALQQLIEEEAVQMTARAGRQTRSLAEVS
jgi:biopolymer transport protein ExbB